jgi:aspartate racemase
VSRGARMKTIGLLGGMSWESTELYYRLINEETRRILGGLHSASIAMISVDFHEIERLQVQEDWDTSARLLSEKARQVEAAGADLLLICTNTMHKVADQVADAIGIPLLHIADATAARVKASGIRTVGLLGTRFTMEQQFYKGRLERSGLAVLVPEAKDRALVNRIIYEELCLGRVNAESRRAFLRIIDALHENGAEAVIEGCTEIGILVGQEHTDVPLFDTTRIHACQAVVEALK